MPIVLAPPSPLGSAASIGIGAGVAEQNAKQFSTLAQLYAHIASLHGAHGGGGGTQGSSSVSPGYGGQGAFPSGYDPAAEQQANRDQQTQNLQTELSADPVAKHLQMQQDFKLQQQQREDAATQQRYDAGQPKPPPTPQPAPYFSPSDQRDLEKSQQGVAELQDLYDSGNLDANNPDAIQKYQQLQGKIAGLQQKQQAATEAEKKKAIDEADQADGHAHMRTARETQTMLKVVPGQKLPSGETVVSTYDDGSPATVKTWSNKAKDYVLHNIPQSRARPDVEGKAAKLRQDTELHETKLEQTATDHYLKHYDAIEKDERAYEDKFMKNAKPEDKRRLMTPEELAGNVAIRMKAKGMRGTLGEFLEDWQRKRGTWKVPMGAGDAPLPANAPKAAKHDVQLQGFNQIIEGFHKARPAPGVPTLPKQEVPAQQSLDFSGMGQGV